MISAPEAPVANVIQIYTHVNHQCWGDQAMMFLLDLHMDPYCHGSRSHAGDGFLAIMRYDGADFSPPNSFISAYCPLSVHRVIHGSPLIIVKIG